MIPYQLVLNLNRSRKALTSLQKNYVENFYSRVKYPMIDQMQELERATRLSSNQIKV